MKNKNHPSETLPIDNSCQTGLPLFSGGVFYMEKEAWKPIAEFEDYYISNYGNIYSMKGKGKSKRAISRRILNRYLTVTLCKNGYGHTKRINRLVAIAFVPNPQNKPESNHIDCNKLNNYYGNLEWCTHTEHEAHTTKNNRRPKGENHPLHRLTHKQVAEMRELYATGEYSQRVLGKMYDVAHTTVGEVVRKISYIF